MKYRVSTWRITWRFLVIYLVILLVALLAASGIFLNIDFESSTISFKEFGSSHIIFISIFAALFLITYIPSIRCFYYIVEDKYFIMKRLGKDVQYDYANIEFIDIEESQKKKMIIFYSSKARMRYMLGDKDGKVLETLIKKCPNTLSVNEFRRRHPEERY